MMIKFLRRAALLLGVLIVGACASAPPPPPSYPAPAPRHPDAKTTLENHY